MKQLPPTVDSRSGSVATDLSEIRSGGSNSMSSNSSSNPYKFGTVAAMAMVQSKKRMAAAKA